MIDMICPVEKANITSPFGKRLDPFSKKYSDHFGVDLQSHTRSSVPIYAALDGIITRAVYHDSFGNYIMISHNDKNTLYTLYAHLDKMSVKVGDAVKQGTVIGMMGKTGDATGIHLHFEVHKGGYSYANGKPVYIQNPMNYISLTKDIGSLREEKSAMKEKVEALEKQVEKMNEEIRNLKNTKADVNSEGDVHVTHKEHWDWGVENGLVNGRSPRGAVTRQQLVTVLYRFFFVLLKMKKK